MDQYILEMEGIYKSFSGVRVLDNVDLKVKKGTVHALIGGNGAGKSTLMKILTGVYTKDAGTIKVDGKPVTINSFKDAGKKGIRMIFQEFSLVPTLTVAENIFLNYEIKKNKFILDEKSMRKKAQKLLDDLDIELDPDTVVADLSVGFSQMVEIAKALSKEAKILIMDEPTASLSETETATLFDLINRLKEKGVTIIYISHRMNEIFQVADEITILRDGKIIITDKTQNFDLEKVIQHMIGKTVEKTFEWKERKNELCETNILEVHGLNVNEKVKDISFNLKKGEILGLAGLMGSGRTEIIESIFGIRKKRGGQIIVDGKKVNIHSVKDSINAGIVLIPEDRRRQGLILMHTVKENITLPLLERIRKNLLIDNSLAKEIVSESINEFQIKTDGMNKEVRLLSGGNQQKVVISKWLKTEPKIILMDEPTAGVDVGAKGEIIDLIRNFADAGCGVIIVSSELAELLAVCDRILVLSNGRITSELHREDISTEEELQHAIQQ